MELKITEDKDNALLERREIEFSVEGEEKTPATAEVKKALCKKLNLSPDMTIVTSISQRFGMRRAECTAHSYKAQGMLERAEPAYLLEREKKKAGKPKAGEPAEAAEQPASAEAKKEAAEANE